MNESAFGESAVEAVGVSKSYWDGGRWLEVLKNISFSVRKGEGVAILGPSGSGKTTLLNILSGLDSPTEGRVAIDGVPLARMSPKDKAIFTNQRIGFVFQFYHLLPEFTALENVLLPACIGAETRGRSEAEARARLLLAKVGLRERLTHYPSELSGGEQQRVAIARALINNPSVLFCDEPTGNLDAKMAEGIIELVRSFYRDEKKTVLVVTHDERIAKMADRVWDIVTRDWTRRNG